MYWTSGVQKTPRSQEVMVDSGNAPPGYYARPSILVPASSRNKCTVCDWRGDCDGSYKCMSYSRPDDLTVVFKRGEAPPIPHYPLGSDESLRRMGLTPDLWR